MWSKRCSALFATALTLAAAGCSDGKDVAEPKNPGFTKLSQTSERAPSKTSTQQATTSAATTVTTAQSSAPTTAASTTRGPDVPVDPANYERAGMSIFTYRVGERTGTCAISPHGATCQGVTPPDAPTVTAVPLPPRKADAIYTGRDGMHFTLFEGVGPTQGDLRPGQSITVEENRCFYPSDNALQCESDGRSFTIQADGTITASGQLDEPPVWTLPDYY